MTRVPSSNERFRTLYEQNYDDIRGYCLRRLPAEDANDAAADVFAIAWRRFDQVPAGNESRLWLYGVARKVVGHQHRKRTRARSLESRLHQSAVTSVDESPTETVVVRRSQDDLVLRALDRLKPADRELIRLKMWEGLTHAEIGEVFGISAHAVDMRVQRASKKLARLVTQQGNVRPHPIAEGGEL